MELTQEEIIIGTEVIGEFMDSLTVDMHGNIKEDLTSFKYHSSWDWLMPVVEKIESIGGQQVFINGCSCNILGEKHETIKSYGTKLEATYKAVVQFIKWYKQQK